MVRDCALPNLSGSDSWTRRTCLRAPKGPYEWQSRTWSRSSGFDRGSEDLEDFRRFIGAPGWDRTSNPCLRRAVLYPLSYGRDGVPILPADARREPGRRGTALYNFGFDANRFFEAAAAAFRRVNDIAPED